MANSPHMIEIFFHWIPLNILNSKEKGGISYNLLPFPQKVTENSTIFAKPSFDAVYISGIDKSHPIFQLLFDEFKSAFNLSLEIIQISDFNKNYNQNHNHHPIPVGDIDNHLEELASFQQDEFYRLISNKSGIFLQCTTAHGIFNGFQTLKQILFQSLNTDPAQTIDLFQIQSFEVLDWPDLSMRGLSDDISRGQIPTIETLKKEIEIWSHYKLNTYALYIEDVIKISSHPQIGVNRGAYSSEELQELIKFAQSRYVTIIPIVETLGHMDNILAQPEYMNLGEFPGSHCLSIANGNIYPFLNDFLSEISANFSKSYLHIGCDEPYDLGNGNSKELIDAVGYEQAIFDFIVKIYQIAKRNGISHVMIYHDLVLKYPTLLKLLPKDIIVVYWNYSPHASYAKDLIPFIQQQREFIVSPSILCWYRHFPQYNLAYSNMVNLISTAKQLNLEFNKEKKNTLGNPIEFGMGELVSTWGDCSNHNLRANNIYGGIMATILGWSHHNSQNSFPKLFHLILQSFYRIQEESVISELNYIVQTCINLNELYQKKDLLIKNRFYDEFYANPFADRSNKSYNPNYVKILTEAQDLAQRLDKIRDKIFHHSKYLEYIAISIDFLILYASKDKLRMCTIQHASHRKAPESSSQVDADYFALLEGFIIQFSHFFTKYKQLWLDCAKYPNFERIEERYQQLYRQLTQKRDEIQLNKSSQPQFLKSKFIWSNRFYSDSKPRLFKKTIIIPQNVSKVYMQVIAGNHAEIYCNQQFVGVSQSRFSLSITPIMKCVSVFDITEDLQVGENTILIQAHHFLKNVGFLNVVIQGELKTPVLSTFNAQNSRLESNVEVLSDKTWSVALLSYEEYLQYRSNNTDFQINWKNSKEIGFAPKFGGNLFHPHLVQGNRSINEDFFRYQDNLFFFTRLLKSNFVARLIRLLLYIFKK